MVRTKSERSDAVCTGMECQRMKGELKPRQYMDDRMQDVLYMDIAPKSERSDAVYMGARMLLFCCP
jgi:hypothetical protein